MTALAARVAGLAICLSFAGFMGCSRNTVSATARVELQEASDADLARAAVVLRARFKEVLPENSSVEARLVDGIIELTFRGEPIADEKIRYFAATQGILRIAPYESQQQELVTDLDVEWVRVTNAGQEALLHMGISEPAGKRMLAYSSKNPESTVVTTWDGGYALVSTIQGEVERSFQTSGFDLTTAERRRVVLTSGRLPVAVLGVRIIHPGDPPPGECEWACPEDGGKYRAALAAAIERADRIVVTEHSSPWDALDESTHEPLAKQEFVYDTVTLNAEQRQQFLTTIEQMDPTTQTWANGCLPVWHHTVRFYEKDKLASTLLICFQCSHLSWDGIQKGTNPDSMHKAMRTFITDLELQPERDWAALANAQLAAR